MITKEKIDWVYNQHRNTNHLYDNYLPYEFHLKMVVEVYKRHKKLVEEVKREDVELACLAHDLIEDTRVSYNDVKNKLGTDVADIVYAVTNEKGKNRSERANDKYYQGIRDVKYASFVKLCDRIANVEYSKMTNSRMFEVYKKENQTFMEKLGYGKTTHNQSLFEELKSKFIDYL